MNWQVFISLSHFHHVTRITAPNHHEDYQRAITYNILSTVLAPKDARTQAIYLYYQMQKKAYRSNQPSKTSYIESHGEQQSLLNFQPAPFNIISLRDEAAKVQERRPMTAIYSGKCKSIHPLSHSYKRTNGPFTDWFDNLKNQKFISIPFKDPQRPPAGLSVSRR